MKRELPIGIDNYRELKEKNYYVVDKSNLIKDFLSNGIKVTLITRPRRFGKTINLSMLAEFLDMRKESKKLFEDTDIMKTTYMTELNQHPVIFLSFKECKGSKQNLVKNMKLEIAREFERYKDVLKREDMNRLEQSLYDFLMPRLYNCMDEDVFGLDDTLSFLMQRIYNVSGKTVYLILDEYDTPFIESHIHGYYSEVKDTFSSMLSKSLKGNPYLNKAMMTGIQRIAKENIFSGLNNLFVCTVKDEEYAKYFGFTTEETKHLLKNYDLTLNEHVKAMYDGYQFGSIEIYNPWSIINYASTKRLEAYWVNTSENKMIRSSIRKRGLGFSIYFQNLIENGYVDAFTKLQSSFYEEEADESLWGLFVNAGYLKIERVLRGDEMRLKIPNEEVRMEFKSIVSAFLEVGENDIITMLNALLQGKLSEFEMFYRQMLLKLPSSFDLQRENSYHMMLSLIHI